METLLLAALVDWLPTKLWQIVLILIAGAGVGVGLMLRAKQRRAAGL